MKVKPTTTTVKGVRGASSKCFKFKESVLGSGVLYMLQSSTGLRLFFSALQVGWWPKTNQTFSFTGQSSKNQLNAVPFLNPIKISESGLHWTCFFVVHILLWDIYRHGWVGVKNQLSIYLPFILVTPLFLRTLHPWYVSQHHSCWGSIQIDITYLNFPRLGNAADAEMTDPLEGGAQGYQRFPLSTSEVSRMIIATHLTTTVWED